MSAKQIVCRTETDMLSLGARLASLLQPPAFVALHGNLGAGKTALVRGMGKRLGAEEVSSPTFMIVQEYDTEPKLLHFDAYRLADSDELYAMGYEEYLLQDALLVMEWAELVDDALPQERLEIMIHGSGCEPRLVELFAVGERYERILEML